MGERYCTVEYPGDKDGRRLTEELRRGMLNNLKQPDLDGQAAEYRTGYLAGMEWIRTAPIEHVLHLGDDCRTAYERCAISAQTRDNLIVEVLNPHYSRRCDARSRFWNIGLEDGLIAAAKDAYYALNEAVADLLNGKESGLIITEILPPAGSDMPEKVEEWFARD